MNAGAQGTEEQGEHVEGAAPVGTEAGGALQRSSQDSVRSSNVSLHLPTPPSDCLYKPSPFSASREEARAERGVRRASITSVLRLVESLVQLTEECMHAVQETQVRD